MKTNGLIIQMSTYGHFVSYGLTVPLILFLQAESKYQKYYLCMIILKMQTSKTFSYLFCLCALLWANVYVLKPGITTLTEKKNLWNGLWISKFNCFCLSVLNQWSLQVTATVAFVFPFFLEKKKRFLLPSYRAFRISSGWHIFWAEWQYHSFLPSFR